MTPEPARKKTLTHTFMGPALAGGLASRQPQHEVQDPLGVFVLEQENLSERMPRQVAWECHTTFRRRCGHGEVPF